MLALPARIMPLMNLAATDLASPAARAARQRREAAARSRAYRERKRAERAPDVRTADAAIVEALSVVLARHSPLARAARAGSPLDEASVPVLDVLGTALEVLVHAGYNKLKSRTMIAERTASRPEHRDPTHVPSIRPVADPARVQPSKRWLGDPPPAVVPYDRQQTSWDVVRGLLLADGDDDDNWPS
jgi:hypothetical protein